VITRINGSNTVSVSDSYYGRKIASYLKAYGADYDFCQFYRLDSGTVMVYNSSAVIDCSAKDEELDSFINMLYPVSVEISNAEIISLPDEYERKKRILFKLCKGVTDINFSDLKVNTSLDDIYAILKESFGITEYHAWYADISHRIRHSIAKTFIYEDKATATMQFCEDGFAFFSHIASAEKYRGRGYARKLLYCIAEELEKNNISGYLFALEHRVSFYREIGFSPISEDILFEKT
jgi:GNAT superfamily N-acetyltransferase